MKQKSALQKGKDLENYVADQLRLKNIDPHAVRSHGSGNGNREKADIETSAMILGRNAGFECKNHARASVKEWWEQTEKLIKLGREPVVVYKLKGESLEESKAILSLDTLLDLMKKSHEPKTPDNNREFRWLIEQLKNTCSKILKIMQ